MASQDRQASFGCFPQSLDQWSGLLFACEFPRAFASARMRGEKLFVGVDGPQKLRFAARLTAPAIFLVFPKLCALPWERSLLDQRASDLSIPEEVAEALWDARDEIYKNIQKVPASSFRILEIRFCRFFFFARIARWIEKSRGLVVTCAHHARPHPGAFYRSLLS
jgi:hypothetical protein